MKYKKRPINILYILYIFKIYNNLKMISALIVQKNSNMKKHSYFM